MTTANRKKLTTQKLHKAIQSKIQVKSSLYRPSQKIDRTTYDVTTQFKGFYGVMSGQFINEICQALDDANIQYDGSAKDRGFVKVPKFQ